MTHPPYELDVRPVLRNGGEPFQPIMQAVAALAPGQSLKLLATFKPVPLFQVLASKGFDHQEREIGGGDWEVLFSPVAAAGNAEPPAVAAANAAGWPAPVQSLDNRDLDPPEPMVRILETAEGLKQGEVLSALLCREPIFLFPELAKRGHQWQGGFEPDGKTYKLLVRIGTAGGQAL